MSPSRSAAPKHSLQFILDRPPPLPSPSHTDTPSSSEQVPRHTSPRTVGKQRHTAPAPVSAAAADNRQSPGPTAPPRAGRQSKSNEEKRRSRQCTIDGCTNYTINRGRCFRHGGGKKCTVGDCDASAKVAGLCWKHGGSVQCSVADCDRRGKSRGLCWAHGGGTLCETEACGKVAVSNGFCWAHGGGKRCLTDGCQRPAYERTLNYCPRHFKQFEQGHAVMEL